MRHQLDVKEDMEQLENDSMTSRFLVANQSSYGRAMDHVMKTFVTGEQELSNVDIRGHNDPNFLKFSKIRIQLRCYFRIIINLSKESQGLAN